MSYAILFILDSYVFQSEKVQNIKKSVDLTSAFVNPLFFVSSTEVGPHENWSPLNYFLQWVKKQAVSMPTLYNNSSVSMKLKSFSCREVSKVAPSVEQCWGSLSLYHQRHKLLPDICYITRTKFCFIEQLWSGYQ